MNGAAVSGAVDLVFTPNPAVNVAQVYFWMPSYPTSYCSWWCGGWTQAVKVADGTWRFRWDTTNLLSGAYNTYASVYWIDELGAGHGRNTPAVTLTAKQATSPSISIRTMSP